MYIEIGPGGKTTDQIIRYAVALYIKQRIGGAEIVNFRNSDWKISTKQVDVEPLNPVSFGRNEFENFDCFFAKKPERIRITWPILNVSLFKSVRKQLQDHLSVLPENNSGERALGDDEMLIHMRMGDITASIHRDYWPLPINFYKELCASRSLKPVFIGELFKHPGYFDEMRKIMPDARMMPPGTIMEDFLRLQTAKRIAISISSYSWLSSWLSETAEEIHLPYCGLFSEIRRPDVRLVDMHDKRYHYHILPNLDWKSTVDVLQHNLSVGMKRGVLTDNVIVWEETRAKPGLSDHVKLRLRRWKNRLVKRR